ncbi:MAG: phycobilisome linker polypeptide [Phormidesmis sp.]
MAGMNVLGSAGISDYQNRTVTIEVSGIAQQSVLKTSNYTVRVPYSQMSQAMQSINRQGGKVASIQLMGNTPVVAENEHTQGDEEDSNTASSEESSDDS